MKTIMVVEDEVSLNENICEILEKEGFNVISFTNGADAVNTLTEVKPSLIILDVLLPNMDGFTILKKLRTQKAFMSIPVIIMSAIKDRTKIRFGMNLGAEDFIMKPFTREELLSAVRMQLKKKEEYLQEIRESEKKSEQLQQELEDVKTVAKSKDDFFFEVIKDINDHLSVINISTYMIEKDKNSDIKENIEILKSAQGAIEKKIDDSSKAYLSLDKTDQTG